MGNMIKSPKEEFIELLADIQRMKGMDEPSSRLIGILFIEPTEISLDNLARETGYSISAVCTSMKFLERTGLVKKFKKPGSRKVYFYMEKDMPSMLTEIFKRFENCVSKLKSRIPDIIDRYKLEKSKSSKEELRILENYYKQLVTFEKMVNKISEILENMHSEFRRKWE